MAPAWWAEQLEGQPDTHTRGSAPSGIPASRTASVMARRARWLSRTPCWQMDAPTQATLCSNWVRTPSPVASSTRSASAADRLTAYSVSSGAMRISAPSMSFNRA